MHRLTNRFFAIAFISFIMVGVFSLGSINKISADDEHSHNGEVFNEWTETYSLPSESGNYYLTNDVEISTDTWTIDNKNISLCLNGHTITSTTSNTIIKVLSNGRLYIYDENDKGTIQHSSQSIGNGIEVEGGFLYLYHCVIKNNLYGINMDGGELHIDYGNSVGITNNVIGIYTKNSTIDINNELAYIKDNTTAAIEIKGDDKVSIKQGSISNPVVVNSDNSKIYIGSETDNEKYPYFFAPFDFKNYNNISTRTPVTIYAGMFNSGTYDSLTNSDITKGGTITFLGIGRKYIKYSDDYYYVDRISGNGHSVNVVENTPDLKNHSNYRKVTVEDGGERLAKAGERIHVQLFPRSEWAVKSIKITEGQNGPAIPYVKNTNTEYSFIMPDNAVRIVVEYDRYYTINTGNSKNCTAEFINCYENNVAFPGDTIRLRFNPTDGSYSCAYITPDNIGDNELTDPNDVTFVMPANNVNIKAMFLKKTTHTHKDGTKDFFLWKESSYLPEKPGSYALDTDVTIEYHWFIEGDINLCLNGHKITMKDSYALAPRRGTFNLYDEGTTGEIHANKRAISLSGETFNMYGGHIDSETGIISINSTINLYAGEITSVTTVDLSNGYLNIGNPNGEPSDIYIKGRISFVRELTNIKLFSGYYDDYSYRNLIYYGERRFIADEKKSFGRISDPSHDYVRYTVDEFHKINIKETANGSVTVKVNDIETDTARSSVGGDTVTLTVKPNSDYQLLSLDVVNKNDGAKVETTSEDNVYHFNMPASDVDVTATFAKKTINVYFDANGGEVSTPSITVVPGEYYGELPIPTKGTIVFAGWYTEKTGGTKIESGTEVTATQNHTLYAHWKDEYTIRFLNDDGEVLLSQKYGYGDTPAQPLDPKKTETVEYTYTFKEWYPAVSVVTGNRDYIAVYTEQIRSYDITFKMSDEDDNPKVLSFEYGQMPVYKETITPPDGKEFDGWNPSLAKVTGTATYVAKFKDRTAPIDQYNVTFLHFSGEVLSSKTYASGTSVEDISVPTNVPSIGNEKGVKEFNGNWYPELSNVTSDVVYVAGYTFTTAKYTVTWLNGNGSVLEEATYDYGDLPSLPTKIPTKDADVQNSYVFNGTWKTDSGSNVTNVRRNVTYIPQFNAIAKEYTVTWENYDGDILNIQKVEYGTIPEYVGDDPVRVPDKTGRFIFIGWSPEISAVTEDVTYTAVYEKSDPQIYNVSFNINGADSGTIASQTINGGEKINKPADPTKSGYMFAGWFADENPESKWDMDDDVVLDNITLTAQWMEEADLVKLDGIDKEIYLTRKDLSGKKVSNKYADHPLVTYGTSGYTAIPANWLYEIEVPEMNSEFATVYPILGIKDDMLIEPNCIYLKIEDTDNVIDTITNDATNKGYRVVENSGFNAEFRRIIFDENNDKYETLYIGVSETNVTVDLDKFGITLGNPANGYSRTFYAAHNHFDNDVEYLNITFSSDKKKGTVTISTLSPFAIVYRDTRESAPDYIPPKTGIE